jgi:hypothetical protein
MMEVIVVVMRMTPMSTGMLMGVRMVVVIVIVVVIHFSHNTESYEKLSMTFLMRSKAQFRSASLTTSGGAKRMT